jgi:hypothetical protein
MMEGIMNRAAGITLVGIALVLSACAGPTPEQKASAAAAKKLTGTEITQTLAGNTVTGRSKTGKSQWTEYYDPSGRILGMWEATSGGDSGKYMATWKIEGDEACYDYEDNQYDGCAAVAINGNQIYWLGDNGLADNPDRPATLIQGKPEGL